VAGKGGDDRGEAARRPWGLRARGCGSRKRREKSRGRAHVPRSELRGDWSWPDAVMQISGEGCHPDG